MKEAKEKAQTITRTLRVEIVKPLNATWEELGTTLRVQRKIMPQLLRAGMDARIACGFVGDATLAEAKRLLDSALDIDALRDTIVAEAQLQAAEEDDSDETKEARKKRVKAALDSLKKAAAGRVARVAGTKATKRATAAFAARGESEATIVYQTIAATLREIQAAKWVSECRPALELPGGTISALAQRVAQSYAKRPSFNGDQPIPIRAQESKLEIRDDKVVVCVKLKSEGRFDLAVKAGKGKHWRQLRELAEGNGDLGQITIKRDGFDTKKWYALISYTGPRPPRPDLCRHEHVMVLHRGQRNLLVAMSNEGKWAVIATGNKLRAQKRAFKCRREELQARSYAERGKGSHGHGRKRRYKTNEEISQAEARCVQTLCQQVGARVAYLAKAWGCGTVLIEKYDGQGPDADRAKRMVLARFPNHRLKESVAWSLAKIGVELGEYHHEHISQICPRCGNVDPKNHNLRTGIFHCTRCKFDRKVDFVSSIHALRRATPDKTAGVWEKRLSLPERLREALARGDADAIKAFAEKKEKRRANKKAPQKEGDDGQEKTT